MSYPYYYNTNLSQSQQPTSPTQPTAQTQQSQQRQLSQTQTSHSLSSYPLSAPWHQPQPQMYRSDIGTTRYVYDNQTSGHLVTTTDPITNTPSRPTQTTVSTPPISGELSIPVSTPVSRPKVLTSPAEEEQMFYLVIPLSQRNRSKVKSLLGEGEFQDKPKHPKETLSPVIKREQETPMVADQEETVESSSGPSLDLSVVPEGQGLVEG